MVFLKGFIVGIGKVIPGVSGSMLAITMGIYEDLIFALTHFFSDVKKNIKLLLPFSLGVLGAIIFFSKVILFFLNIRYNETLALFLGLILGTLISFFKDVKMDRKGKLLFLGTLLIFFLMGSLKLDHQFLFDGAITDYLWTFLFGGVDAMSSIIPGISGTAIYLLMGVYEYVLDVLSTPFSIVFVIYMTGAMVGGIITSFLMAYLLDKRKNETYAVLLALMVGSLFLLGVSIFSSINLLVVILFFLGVFLAKFFS